MPESTPAPEGDRRTLRDLIERWAREGRLRGPIDDADSPDATPAADLALTGVRDDSRKVKPCELFVAVRGLNVDGHEFVTQAIERGAAAIAVERRIDGLEAIQIEVDRGAAALASAAAWWYGDPSHQLLTVGVTGTNGKTTTSFLAQAGLEAAGLRTGLVGTIGIRVAGELRRNEEPNTTPGALELQRILREMVVAGEEAVVLETSSHGLAADRVASVDYDAAIFTNLSHEHLDFHGTFEAYRDAKLSLFSRLHRDAKSGLPGIAAVNLDDPHGPMFAKAATRAGARVVGYGEGPDAEVRLEGVRPGNPASLVHAAVGARHLDIRLRVPGNYNATNALAVLALAHGWELDLGAVVAGLEGIEGVPGRMERLDRGQPFVVVVDFAHTPRSLEVVLGELEPLVADGAGIVTVFGSSGERDVAKRPLMGEATARGSRLVIVTEDDSRGENPQAIFDQIAVGAEKAGKRRGDDLLIIPDRSEAIAEALRRARTGDVVLLAGKGHETWNIGASGPEPWSDRETALELLAELAPGPSGPV